MSLKKNDKFSRNEYDRDHYDWKVDCDPGDSSHCEGALGFEHMTFREAVDEIKTRGWQIYKDERTGEWKHRCVTCKEEKKLQAMERLKDESHG